MESPPPEPPAPSTGRRIALALGRTALVGAGLLVGLVAYVDGLVPPFLLGCLVLGVAWGISRRVVMRLTRRGRPRPRLFGGPPPVNRRALRLQALNRCLFWLAAGGTLVAILPDSMIRAEEARELWLLVAGLVLVNVALALRPAVPTVRLWANLLPLAGWMFLAEEWVRIAAGPPGPPVELALPFRGEWSVVQGGRSALINHHYPIPAQSHALDLVRVERGLDRRDDAPTLENYYAFGAELFAPAGGMVVVAEDGNPDVPIGETDLESLVGNHVVIMVEPGRHVLMAHLQKGSVAVRQGQVVRAGDPVGRCGNSGNTSEPHLHLQVQSSPDFRARGLRTFPMAFPAGTLRRGGRPASGSPRRNDVLVGPAGGREGQAGPPGAGNR